MTPTQGLTVAVTGPTGDLGIALVSALERSRAVGRIIGMARRPFDPASRGWKKTEYRRGDVQSKPSVRAAVKGADVVVPLAFSILSSGSATRSINVDGSRHVFEAALDAGAQRICYASSVAAYGFHPENPKRLDEDVPPRGTPASYYSEHKAEVEALLARMMLKTARTQAYVFRPCIVAGPTAQALIEEIPYTRLAGALPDAVRRALSGVPGLKPVLPDPGVPFQLVHEDDVASAFLAGVLGEGAPGPYNLAANGTITMTDLADALGWHAIPIPRLTVQATAELISRSPLVPEVASWIEAARTPVLMRTQRARKELGWKPAYTAKQTLKELVG
jgi:nucleoside-diphosphate-sugar epimerase